MNSPQAFIRSAALIALLPVVSSTSLSQWMPTGGPYGGDVQGLNVGGREHDLWAATRGGGIFRSSDTGRTWRPGSIGLDSLDVLNVAGAADELWAGTSGGLYELAWSGWTLDTNVPRTRIVSLSVAGAVFAGTGSVTYSNVEFGSHRFRHLWQIQGSVVSAVAVGTNYLVTNGSSFGRGEFDESSHNTYWSLRGSLAGTQSLIATRSAVIAGTYRGVFRSTDLGLTWTASSAGMGELPVLAVIDHRDMLIAATEDGMIFRSGDEGLSWSRAGEVLPGSSLKSIASDVGVLIAGVARHGAYRSTDDGATWTASNTGITNRWIEALLVDGARIYAAGHVEGLWQSDDNGGTWRSMRGTATGDTLAASLRSLGSVGPAVFVASSDELFRSTDRGGSWRALRRGGRPIPVTGMTVDGSSLYIHNDQEILRSSDLGESWTVVADHFGRMMSVRARDGVVWAVGSAGIYRSTDDGIIWYERTDGLLSKSTSSILLNGETLVAGGDDGIHRSTDDGATWQHVSSAMDRKRVRLLEVFGSQMFASTGLPGGLYRSTDDGRTWSPIGGSLGGHAVRALAIDGEYLLAGTSGGSVWRALLSSLGSSSVPAATHAAIPLRAYPNPADDLVTIELPDELRSAVGAPLDVVVHGVDGIHVDCSFALSPDGTRVIIRTSDFLPGFYGLRIARNGSIGHIPFVVLR